MSGEHSQYFDALVENYFSDIRLIEPPSEEELLKLFPKAQNGSREAISIIILSNLKLVISIAKRYAHNKLMFLDMVQEGNIGLIKSIQKYDPSLGFKFSTFASFWIKQEIIRSIENKGRLIRIPVNISKTINKLKKAMNNNVTQTGEVDKKAVSQFIKINEDKIENLMQYFDDSCSIEKLIDKNCQNMFIVENESMEPEDIAVSNLAMSEIQVFLDKYLTGREKETMILRFGLLDNVYKTHQEVADMLGISRERVRQLEASAIEKLKRAIESNPDERILLCA
ncbi:MAG: RNA polymerase sigma factor RpoD/SigA [Candidatus Wallbacteria bacterium]